MAQKVVDTKNNLTKCLVDRLFVLDVQYNESLFIENQAFINNPEESKLL